MTRMQYASRTMEGVEMAEITARDLKLRLPGGDSCDAASFNPTVKIDLSGRKLTDEGFDIFIDALLETLQKERDDKHPEGFVRLFELQLSGNCLTYKSLPKLGRAIRLSTGDLSNIDLSQNCIQVSTARQKAAWKYFLASFEECYMLKRVNLSENPLGTPGVEILARVYIRSNLGFPNQEAPLPDEGTQSSVVGEGEDLPSDDNSPNIDHFTSLSIEDKAPSSAHPMDKYVTPQPEGASEIASESNQRHFRKTRGLRSVPELIMTGIPMSAIGVIHLSGMLKMQESREFLCYYLPETEVAASQSEAEEKNPSITWRPNEHLPQKVSQLLYWATEISKQAPSFYGPTLSVAISNLETPIPIASRKGKPWEDTSCSKFHIVAKRLYDLATASEIRDSEIWGIAVRMGKMVETILFNKKCIYAQLLSGKMLQCFGLERDMIDAINLGLFHSRQRLDGQELQEPEESWLGLSLDTWVDIMGMSLDKGNFLTTDQKKCILEYVVSMGGMFLPAITPMDELWEFLLEVNCIMYHES
ncbi:uncharacterized protein N7500_002602 [Penicillium coprophilum]|uniref:uncharacterized protein n=1 Tax=Penicillium coprophilum TaxID=36646 RepID=UPI00238E4A53|nr:uncharacterized protein N7500_002602 [Penicillium coprophilum]KAJ5169819.1 hypothetical protein N7500_002602 [Penicillium coprophilum]